VTKKRGQLGQALAKTATSISSMITAFSEQLLTIDELRARMPDLRARETSLKDQIAALDAQAADRDAYLKLADDLEGFLARLRENSATATTESRQRVLRAVVQDILIGPEKLTIRHRIPVREPASGNGHHDSTDTEGDMREGSLLRWGRVSPVMCNVYLHRLDRAWDDGDGVLVRFADDLVVMCWSRSQPGQALARLTGLLAGLGLEPKAAKTRIVHLEEGGEGFDFLGFHHRLVRSRGRNGEKPVTFLARWALGQGHAARPRPDPVPDRAAQAAAMA
jgi:hypothetical protein